jgi:hypothetical protein
MLKGCGAMRTSLPYPPIAFEKPILTSADPGHEKSPAYVDLGMVLQCEF